MLKRIKKKNDMHEGKWNGLGGKMEGKETPEECVAREVFEESGLKIKNPKLKGILYFPNNVDKTADYWIVFVFTANDFEGKLNESEEGLLEWVDSDKILDLKLWEGDRIFIPLLFKDDFFTAKLDYKDGKLVRHEVRLY